MRWDANGKIGLGDPIRLETQFQNAAGLPSWLTSGALSGDGVGASYNNLDPFTTKGGVQLTTGAANSNQASLSFPEIDLQFYRAVRLRCVFSTDAAISGTFSLSMSNGATTLGAGYAKVAGSNDIFMRAVNRNQQRYVKTYMTPLTTQTMFDVSVLIDCLTDDIMLMHGDEVHDIWRNAPMDLGIVVPRFLIANGASTTGAKRAIVRKLQLDRWPV